ncbi:6357_t:CDS:2, partial [Paraglomus brasilianum]
MTTVAAPYIVSSSHTDEHLHLNPSETPHLNKSVQFSRELEVHETWCSDEYDRTSMEPAKLTYKHLLRNAESTTGKLGSKTPKSQAKYPNLTERTTNAKRTRTARSSLQQVQDESLEPRQHTQVELETLQLVQDDFFEPLQIDLDQHDKEYINKVVLLDKLRVPD